MRIIKFRGKCVPDSKYAGEWVKGGYAPLDEESTSKNKGEGLIVVFLGGNCSCSYHVITETVGQFTGLHDKNGTEIYEGDIMVIETIKGKRMYSVKWNEKHMTFYIGNAPATAYLCDGSKLHDYYVIGNIFDNPGLLKGGKDEDS